MNVKLRKLCNLSPRSANLQTPLDNIATIIFDPPTDHKKYVCSSLPLPERSYGIAFDRIAIDHKNEFVKNFDEFGPNEKFLINKIMFSSSHLLLIVGGIGVGKTSFFTNFYLKDIPSKIIHSKDQSMSNCPFYIYFDMLNDVNYIQGDGLTINQIKSRFSNALCEIIQKKIADLKFFIIEEEVGPIWEKILNEDKNNYSNNLAFSRIAMSIRNEDAEIKDKNGNKYEEALKARRAIRNNICSDSDYHLSYIQRILLYIKKNYYQGHQSCMLIIIDNVDRLEMQAQQAIKLVLKPFARGSKIRTILPIRQTTFDQSFKGDHNSEPVDTVPFCGATPLEVVERRLINFSSSYDICKEYLSYKDFDLLNLSFEKIIKNCISVSWFKTFFNSFVGRSVRKGLILAQNIIDNSVYNVIEIGNSKNQLKHSELIRGLLVGSEQTYNWTNEGIIENIFQTQCLKDSSNLIKVRILRILSLYEEKGLPVGELLEYLDGFDYQINLIFHSINELLSKYKRLIWTDAVPIFDSENDLIRHQHTKIRITSIGQGYAKHLYKDMDYMQEIMLDVYVSREYFGDGWNYGGSKEVRFQLLYRFCKFLFETDQKETERFVFKNGAEQFKKISCQDSLLVDDIIRSSKKNIESLLNFSLHQNDKEFIDLLGELNKDYNDLILQIDQAKERLLGHPTK